MKSIFISILLSLFFISVKGQSVVSKASDKKDNSWTIFHTYAQKGQNDSLLGGIKYGYYVNISTHKKIEGTYKILDDYTPLMLAAKEGHLQTCKILMLYGADPFLKNVDNKSAIDLAQEKRFIEVVKALKNKDCGITSENWETLLKEAESAYSRGEFVIANSFANAAFNVIPKNIIQKSSDFNKMLTLLAKSYEEIAVFNKAEYFLKKSIEWNEKNGNSNEYIVSLLQLSSLFNKTADYDKNRLLLQILMEYLKSPDIHNKLLHAKILDANAYFLLAKRKPVEAGQWFGKALRIKKMNVGMVSYEYALSLIGIFKALEAKKLFFENNKDNKVTEIFLNNANKNDIPPALTQKEGFNADFVSKLCDIIKAHDGIQSSNYQCSLKLLLYSYQLNKQNKHINQISLLIESSKKSEQAKSFKRGLAYYPATNEEIIKLRKPVLNQEEFDNLVFHQNVIVKTYGRIHPIYLEVLKNLSKPKSVNKDRFYIKAVEEEMRLISTKLTINRASRPYENPTIYFELLPDIEHQNNEVKNFALEWAKKTDLGVQFLYNHIVQNQGSVLWDRTESKKEIMEIAKEASEDDSPDVAFLKSLPPDKAAEVIRQITKFNENVREVALNQFVNSEQSGVEEAMGITGSFNPDELNDEYGAFYSELNEYINYGYKEIRSILKPGQVLVQYFYVENSSTEINSNDKGIEYYALILKYDSFNPILKYVCKHEELLDILNVQNNLSSEEKINAIYRGERTEPTNSPNKTQPTKTNKTAKQGSLYELCWKEIESSIESTDTSIYYSPAGLMNQVSFVSILTPQKKVLIDKYKFYCLSSTSSFIESNKRERKEEIDENKIDKKSQLILFGNPNSEIGALSFASEEVNTIKKYFRSSNVQSYEREKATEKQFTEIGKKNINSSRIIHIAAHGAYLKEGSINSKNPLLRSIIYLSGSSSNKARLLETKMSDDGLLTAYEIADLNFSDTPLVVLSACESGIGDIGGDEGVFGLRRAFKIAGAEYVLSSLWRIPDKETSEMMGYFYKNMVILGQSIPDAFYNAQKSMKAKYSPYHWGAFVLVK
ncbi:CHAT domain-containing protein [Flectobacillus longus]|uniref:CHAT domain-containing protein n=1 Tax=Flectobacillus longus TaxID=2984207 RepID=UPI0024B82D46|nr:CHAT domain-containing protein [Flectobacillus longus]MDI9878296.1 CHAT domain-containing protein [Flectobacillus longus]